MPNQLFRVIAAQFFSGLADSALLIVAIDLLAQRSAPAWETPLLKLLFNAFYVLLAVYAGAFADAVPKAKAMTIASIVKLAGCLFMASGLHPLLAYGMVGLGAAIYSPAKLGLVADLSRKEQLVAVNGWIEASGIAAIILGTVLGGSMLGFAPAAEPRLDHFMEQVGISDASRFPTVLLTLVYALATVLTLRLGSMHATSYRPIAYGSMLAEFLHAGRLLWRDQASRISLYVTALFWGTGAVLQFIVLAWAQSKLRLPLGKAAMLQGAVAIGVTVGAVIAARRVPLERAFQALWIGVAVALLTLLLVVVQDIWSAVILLIVVGACSGYFVVPMNAILQDRGRTLVGTGTAVAVQNCSENFCVLGMLALYSSMVAAGVSVDSAVVLFSGILLCSMLVLIRKAVRVRRVSAD